MEPKHPTAWLERRILCPAFNGVLANIRLLLRNWRAVICLLSAVSGAGYLIYIIFHTHHFFWDFHIYVAAVKTMAAGVSPYNRAYILGHYGTDFPFLYPPFVATVLHSLSWLFLTKLGVVLFCVVHLIAWMSIPYLEAGSPKQWRSTGFAWVFGLYLVLFGLGGIKMFASGNLAAIMASALIYSIVRAIRTSNYRLFWLILFACSYIKIYFICFLLVPFALDRRFTACVLFLAALIIFFVFDYWLHPDLFSQFLTVIRDESRNSDMVGRSLFSLVNRIAQLLLGFDNLDTSAIAAPVHLLFASLVATLSYGVMRRHLRPVSFDALICWLFLSACLVSPRLLDYDTALLVVPLAIVVKEILADQIAMGVAIVAAGFAFILTRTPLSDWSGMFCMMGIWAGGAIHYLNPSVPRGRMALVTNDAS